MASHRIQSTGISRVSLDKAHIVVDFPRSYNRSNYCRVPLLFFIVKFSLFGTFNSNLQACLNSADLSNLFR